MSGSWRITIDSWITRDANWYGRRTYDVEADNLREALQRVYDLGAEALFEPHSFEICRGRRTGAPRSWPRQVRRVLRRFKR